MFSSSSVMLCFKELLLVLMKGKNYISKILFSDILKYYEIEKLHVLYNLSCNFLWRKYEALYLSSLVQTKSIG